MDVVPMLIALAACAGAWAAALFARSERIRTEVLAAYTEEMAKRATHQSCGANAERPSVWSPPAS